MLLVLSSSMPAHSQRPQEPTLPSTGIDFAAVDAVWRVVDVLSEDREPSEAQWQALLTSPGYQFAQIAVGDVIREDLQAAFRPSRRVEFDRLTKLPNDRASRLTHLQRAATLRSRLVAFQDSLGRSDLIQQAVATAARFLPAGATNAGDPPLVAFALFRYDGYAVRSGIVVDLLRAYEANLVLFLAHEFHHTYLHRATGTFVPSAAGHTALREALEQLRSEGIADLIDKPHPLSATNPQLATYVQRYNQEYEKTPMVLRELDSLLSATTMDSAQIRSAGQRARRLLWNGGHAQGAYMARQILTTFGADSLFPGVTNPAAFFRAFAAAEKVLGRPDPWSPETVKVIEALERRYWRQRS
jgi:Putative zinc dependent peptidase (DUF5700)